MVNDAGGAGRQIEFLGEQRIHSDDAVPLEVDHGVMADIKIAKVLYADSVCIRSLNAGWGLVKRPAYRQGAIRKRRQVLRNLAETSLQVRRLHGVEPFKVVIAIEIAIRRNKGMVVLNQQDLTVHLKSI